MGHIGKEIGKELDEESYKIEGRLEYKNFDDIYIFSGDAVNKGLITLENGHTSIKEYKKYKKYTVEDLNEKNEKNKKNERNERVMKLVAIGSMAVDELNKMNGLAGT